MKVGIDIGSTTIKFVVMDDAKKIIHKEYSRHFLVVRYFKAQKNFEKSFINLNRVHLCKIKSNSRKIIAFAEKNI